MPSESRTVRSAFAGVLAGTICVAVAITLLVRWWPPVDEGIASLKWPSVPGEIVYASFYSEYDAAASHGMDGEHRDEYTSISIAYWVPVPGESSIPLVTRRFDTASGLLKQPGLLAGHAHEVRSLLAAGEALRVHYDPDDPSRAVIFPGPPWAFTALMALPVVLLGTGIGLLRWSVRAKEHVATPLILWPSLFLTCAIILVGLLPAIWVRFSGEMLPWWVLPGVYAFGLLCFAAPPLVKLPPIRQVAMVLPMFVLATLVCGIVVLATTDHRAAFGTDWSDDQIVERLRARHPAIAEDAAWTVMRREGPRHAAPALQDLLGSSSIDARRAAAVALTRVGPSALPTLVAVESALEDPANSPIEESLEQTRDHLRGYIWLQGQVEGHRHRLLHDEDGQARNGAAFSLGQIGELAISAIPDLEKAALDPKNRSFAEHMHGVAESLRRYEHAAD